MDKTYINHHKFEQEMHDPPEYNTISEDTINLAEYIHNNISHMDSVEMKNLYAKITGQRKMYGDLLRYELLNLNLDTKISSLNDGKKFISKYLKRYHLHVGGFLCEDSEWTIHTPKTNIKKYPLKHNEIIFENSIKDIHKYDSNLTTYFSELLQFFKRHMDNNMSVKYYLIKHTDKICWIVLKLVCLHTLDESTQIDDQELVTDE